MKEHNLFVSNVLEHNSACPLKVVEEKTKLGQVSWFSLLPTYDTISQLNWVLQSAKA